MTELSSRALDRRTMLKRGAMATGAAVWAVPAVQALSMTSAHAASPSGAPTNPISTPPTSHSVGPVSTSHAPPSKGIDASTTAKPAPSSSGAAGGSGSGGSGGGAGVDASTTRRTSGLANTGPAVPLPEALAIGLGAIAVGTAATVAGRKTSSAGAANTAAAPPAPRRPRPTHTG